MSIVIHWIGEERVLGGQNVLLQPDGSKLLTNPGAMAKIAVLIWGVGACQLLAGGYLAWKSVNKKP